jgi:hypothetical protein
MIKPSPTPRPIHWAKKPLTMWHTPYTVLAFAVWMFLMCSAVAGALGR